MIGKTAIWQNSILDIMVPRIMHPANVLVLFRPGLLVGLLVRKNSGNL